MSDTRRYAIYSAPLPETALWAFGSRVLGYDAVTGEEIYGFAPSGMSADAWRGITERPRTYGFHATLKAPFSLNGQSEDDLREALDVFAAHRKSVILGRLLVSAVSAGADGSGFVAMKPESAPGPLAELERDIVTGFDHFRRPMTEEERVKRRPDNLTEQQRTYLDTYGYPYVLDAFSFHMTLSGEIANADKTAAAIAADAERLLGTVQETIEDLCLFRQVGPDCRFTIISRHRLAT
jgi:Protein of unknown function (DUF1045)